MNYVYICSDNKRLDAVLEYMTGSNIFPLITEVRIFQDAATQSSVDPVAEGDIQDAATQPSFDSFIKGKKENIPRIKIKTCEKLEEEAFADIKTITSKSYVFFFSLREFKNVSLKTIGLVFKILFCKECAKWLEKYDAIGIDFKKGKTFEFYGNTWWTSNRHIKNLPEKCKNVKTWLFTNNGSYLSYKDEICKSLESLQPKIVSKKIIPKPDYRTVQINKTYKTKPDKPLNNPWLLKPKKPVPRIKFPEKKGVADLFITKKTIEAVYPIYVYLHVHTVPNWAEYTTMVYNGIKQSGLLDMAAKIIVTGEGNYIHKIVEIMNHPKVQVIFYKDDVIDEAKTFFMIRELAGRENFFVYYMKICSTEFLKKDYYIDFLRLVLYMNICNFDVCVESLNKYDTCGILLSEKASDGKVVPTYAENIWWSKSQYIQTLSENTELKHWIGLGKEKRMLSFWQTTVKHRKSTYNADQYISMPLHMWEQK